MVDFTRPVPDDILSWSWLVVCGFSVWGGIVRYLIDTEQQTRTFYGMLSQVVISSFTGVLGGFYCYEHQWSGVMTLAVSGICSTFGGGLLCWLWNRFIHSA